MSGKSYSLDEVEALSAKKSYSPEDVEKMEVKKEPPTDPRQAGLEHFGNAALFGYLPHVQAAAGFMTGGDYVDRRDENIARIERERNENPAISLAASIAGAVATGVPIGKLLSTFGAATLTKMAPYIPALQRLLTSESKGVSVPPRPVPPAQVPPGLPAPPQQGLSVPPPPPSRLGTDLAKQAARAERRKSVIQKIGDRAANIGKRSALGAPAAAIMGAAINPGDRKGEVAPFQPFERAANAGASMAIGVPLNAGAEAINTGLKAAYPAIRKGANKLAMRALGPFKRQITKNRNRIDAIGKEALDEKVIRWKPGTHETLEKRAKGALDAAGAKMGKIVDELYATEKKIRNRGVDMKVIVDEARRRLINRGSKVPGIQDKNAFFEAQLDRLEKGEMLNLKQIRDMKLDVGGVEGRRGLINWDRLKHKDIPILEEYHRKLYGVLKEAEAHGADALEKIQNGGVATNAFRNAKAKFHNLGSVNEIAGNKADAERANQILGLGSKVVGTGGAVIGGGLANKASGGSPVATVIGSTIGYEVAAIYNHLQRNYGAQFSSKVLHEMAELINRSPALLNTSKKYPNLIPHILHSLSRKTDLRDKEDEAIKKRNSK